MFPIIATALAFAWVWFIGGVIFWRAMKSCYGIPTTGFARLLDCFIIATWAVSVPLIILWCVAEILWHRTFSKTRRGIARLRDFWATFGFRK